MQLEAMTVFHLIDIDLLPFKLLKFYIIFAQAEKLHQGVS